MTVRPRAARWLAAPALALAVALVAGSGPAGAALPEPLPGTATSKFFTGWFPYWYGTLGGATEISRLVAHSGPEGYVGEVMVFTMYSRYRTGGIQDPVCVHDGSDVKATECARTAPTATQAAQRDTLQAAGIKVFPSFTDDGSRLALSGVMADPVKRAALVMAQRDYVVNNGYDGLDLDYEGFAFRDGSSTWDATRPGWILYVKALSAALHAQGKLLSVTVPAGYPTVGAGYKRSSGYTVYAWADIIDSIDRLRLMTYDYSYDTAGPIGPSAWVDEVASDAVEELGRANAPKVWLGIAAYGYDWRTASACQNPSASSKRTRYPADAIRVYNEAVAGTNGRRLVTDSYHWDTTSGEYTYRYIYADVDSKTQQACSTTREVWFQDALSHERRALIAAKYGLGGVAMWALGDERDDTWTRLTAAAPSIKPFKPVLTLTATSKVAFGQQVNLRATVTRPDGLALSGAGVTLRWRPAGTASWTTIVRSAADAQGAVSFSPEPTGTGEWQIITATAIGRRSSESPIVTTVVTSSISAVVRSRTGTSTPTVVSTLTSLMIKASVRRKSVTQVWGHVSPAAGQRVALYRARPTGGWVLDSSRYATSTGAYSFAIATDAPSLDTYQVRTLPTDLYALGRSLPITIKVR